MMMMMMMMIIIIIIIIIGSVQPAGKFIAVTSYRWGQLHVLTWHTDARAAFSWHEQLLKCNKFKFKFKR
jgi:hypothetical protein